MITPPLLPLLLCPACCQGALEPIGSLPEDDTLRCVVCHARYPIRFGLPILVTDAALTQSESDVGNDQRTGSEANGHGGAKGSARRRRDWFPERLGRARNVFQNQGLQSFVDKARRAMRTEMERRLPSLRRGPQFVCPCCGAREAFLSYRGRPRAQCPQCRAKERDRLLVLVLGEVLASCGPFRHVLHVAPEARVRAFLAPRTETYVSTDLTRGLASYAGELSAAADLTRLPFRNESFDLVLASHVLEHIPDDLAAVREVHRVLRPGGIALLPVPIVHGGATVEYGAPRPFEEMHVRAPGLDYFDRFEHLGFEVVVRRSSDYSAEHQLHSYHTHSELVDGNATTPIGSPDESGREQYIPICFKENGQKNGR